MPPTSSTASARRSRRTIACQTCRQRKVRCSLNVTGVPCIGCTQDRTPCIVTTRRGQKSEKHGGPVLLANLRSPDQALLQTPARRVELPAFQVQPQQHVPLNVEATATREAHDIEDEERNGDEIAAAALGQPRRVGEIPFYTGDRTGPVSTLDICSPDHSLPRHCLIPSNNQTTMTDDDREYLQKKGVFTLPKPEVCEGLLRAYFYHVHPIMPVIEVDSILNYQHHGRLGDCNFLLLWSVFFVAVNFISPRLYEQEGYVSRKEMKATMYSRAKCMYDNGGERNKVTLLQASLLLGFWHSEQDDHMQPWYWTGIAINLCQMLGLHRDPDSLRYNSSITDCQRRLWRRLWWTCFFRDRWLGLTLGRPLRINLDDCDLPMSVPADLLSELDSIPRAISASYIPQEFPKLAEFWIILIELSQLLGKVLVLKNQPVKSKSSMNEINALEAQIMRCRLPDQDEHGLTHLAKFYAHHVHLHYHALLITLYRPSGSEHLDNLALSQQGSEQQRLQSKANAAASKSTEILDILARENLLEYVGPMTPALLVPVMQTHLLNCKYANPLSRRFSFNKLDMCMGVLEELQKTYTVASLFRGIFIKALQQIFPTYTASSPLSISHQPVTSIGDLVDSHSDTVPIETTNGECNQVIGDRAGSSMPAGFIDALIDENSIFDFLDSWSEI
ncbi:fungal-specific transcription factor domain-containing protein [Aspergillus minisclerotigenes]|uniref:Fungal-specific transcription factor domain-containing protein n=1 Tax=Aspergillus minisclerotigenes TaxID=656917 RepID=A0A5N6IWR6_9EURO|nr:fungal-specific transcription factor domain-containing protein [Aspergillus minisclerotigenes]